MWQAVSPRKAQRYGRYNYRIMERGAKRAADAEGAGPEGRLRLRTTIICTAAGAVCLAAVALLGWYQFGHRAATAIDRVKSHRVPGTGKTIGESVEEAVRSHGYEVVAEGFKPSWGAEETQKGLWVVSYVFEVGREAHWVSWKVDTRSGEVTPRDSVARELWYGP